MLSPPFLCPELVRCRGALVEAGVASEDAIVRI